MRIFQHAIMAVAMRVESSNLRGCTERVMCKDWGCVYLVSATSSVMQHLQSRQEMEATGCQWMDADVHISFNGVRHQDGYRKKHGPEG